MDHRILTVTVNPALDVSVAVAELVPDHKLEATSHRRDAGGGGINVAMALHELGLEATAFVVAGGPIGEELLGRVEAAGLSTVAFRIDGNARESIAVRDESTGRQYRVILEGPVVADGEGLEAAILATADDADIVVLSGRQAPGQPLDFYRRLTEQLSPRIVVVDGMDEELAEVVKGTPTIVKPSRRELASLVGWVPADGHEIEQAGREVLARGASGALVVSLGPAGAALIECDGPTTWFTPPPVEAVSTVGCGDAMVAGIVGGLAEGLSLTDAVRLGVAAGTATATTPGTQVADGALARRLEPDVVVNDAPPNTARI